MGPVGEDELSTTAGIFPVDISDLAAFLREHDGPAYKLTYTDEGSERSVLLWDASVDAVRLEQPDRRPGVLCTPLAPGEDQFVVSEDAIERLHVVEPAPVLYTRDAGTPAEEAKGLYRLSKAAPELVQVATVVELLGQDDPDCRRDALRALDTVAAARPADCVPAVPALRSLLEESGSDELDRAVRPLRVLRRVGEERPADIAPAAEAIGWYVDVPLSLARHEAARAVAAVAEEYPEDAVGAVPELTRALEATDGKQEYAVFALCRIAREFPEAVEPAAGVLGEVGLDDEQSDNVRLNATTALGRVTKESPDAGVEVVEEVLELLDAGNERLRANTAGLLADVAAVHTDVLEPHVGRVAGLLTDDDPHARANATCVLARVAEDFPEAVTDRVPALVGLLDDEEAVVRKRACRALGRLEAADAAPPLWERARNDEDREVRDQARWALTRIEGVD